MTLIALVVLGWLACGGVAVWMAYRKWEQFERDLNALYPLTARPVTRKVVLDGLGRGYLLVIGLLGVYGLIAMLGLEL